MNPLYSPSDAMPHPLSFIKRRYFIFPLLIGASNLAIWGASSSYLEQAERTYDSTWSISLQDTEENTRITLPDLGATTSQIRSPFDEKNRDPRANYKFIATSQDVIKQASQLAEVPIKEFQKPRIDIVDNTTLMKFTLTGGTPEEAYQKAVAFGMAFSRQLELLRAQESQQRRGVIEAALQTAKAELDKAQINLATYKANAGVAAPEQVTQLSSSIENFRIQRALALAEQQESQARLQKFSQNLQVSGKQIADSFLLEADDVFRQHLQAYSQANSQVEILTKQLGPNHPLMVQAQSRQSATYDAMLGRGNDLLGYQVSESTLAQLALGNQGNSAREELFKNAFAAEVDSTAISAKVSTLDQQLQQLEQRLQMISQQQSNLNILNREMKIAEAVFSSYLARLNAANAEVFGSYPPIQTIHQPNQPSSPSSPRESIVKLGTLMSSCLVTLALLALWLRPQRKQPAPLAVAGSNASSPLLEGAPMYLRAPSSNGTNALALNGNSNGNQAAIAEEAMASQATLARNGTSPAVVTAPHSNG